jgi:hypothetical protein
MSTAAPPATPGPAWGATAFQMAPALDRTQSTTCRRNFIANFDHVPGSRSTRLSEGVPASFRADDHGSQHGGSGDRRGRGGVVFPNANPFRQGDVSLGREGCACIKSVDMELN